MKWLKRNNWVGKKQSSNINIFEVPERQKPTAHNKTHIFKYNKVFLEQKALIHQLKVHTMYQWKLTHVSQYKIHASKDTIIIKDFNCKENFGQSGQNVQVANI